MDRVLMAAAIVMASLAPAQAQAQAPCGADGSNAAADVKGTWEMYAGETAISLAGITQKTAASGPELVKVTDVSGSTFQLSIKTSILEMQELRPKAVRTHDNIQIRTALATAAENTGDSALFLQCPDADEPEWRATKDVSQSDGTQAQSTTYLVFARPDLMIGVQHGFVTLAGTDTATEFMTPIHMLKVKD